MRKIQDSLVVVRNNEAVISTWLISQKVGVTHQTIKRAIDRLKIPIFDTAFISASANESGQKKLKKGGQIQELFLTEENAAILCVQIAKKSNAVLEFKTKMVKEFYQQRRLLDKIWKMNWVNGNDPEREKIRIEGKKVRLEETDATKLFIQRAIRQGSTGFTEKLGYAIVTKQTNRAIFEEEAIKLYKKGFRDMVSGFSLSCINVLDHIVAKVFMEGEKLDRFYKDTWEIAKEKINAYGNFVGKLPVNKFGNEIGMDSPQRLN